MNLVDKSYWENWAGRPEDFSGYTLLFHEVLIKYIGYDEGKRFLEIGCSPGRNLIYFNRTFGFIPSGIDFLCNFDIVEKNLKSHKIKEFSLYNEDFLTFELNKTYDVVGTFGFLEHFEKWEPVLDKIIHCTKKGGYVITSVPHFRYGQYFLRKLLTPDVFERHNISVMDKSKLNRFFESRGLELIYSNYHSTFLFWGDEPPGVAKKLMFRGLMKFARLLQQLKVNVPNRLLSPHILIIAKRV